MLNLTIERTPPLDESTEDGQPPIIETIGNPIVNTTPPEGSIPIDSGNTFTMPDGTIVAQAPPAEPLWATRNPDGTIVITHVPVNQTPIPTQVAHDVLSDLLSSLSSPMVYLKAHPYTALAVGSGLLYFAFKKKK